MSDIFLACTPLHLDHPWKGSCLLVQIDSYRFLMGTTLPEAAISQSLLSEGALPEPARPPQETDSPAHPPTLNPDPERNLPLHGLILTQVQASGVLVQPSFRDARLPLDSSDRSPSINLYTSQTIAQVSQVLNPLEGLPPGLSLQPLPWRSPTQIHADLTLELIPAGYSPGAAMVLLTYTPQRSDQSPKPYTVLYTGHCTLAHRRSVEGLPLTDFRGLRPDLLIMDGTAGTLRYRRRRHQERSFLAEVDRCLQGGRSLVLPVESWGMVQELLLLLKTHGPLADQHITLQVAADLEASLNVYPQILPELPTALQNLAQQRSLFWEDAKFPRVQRLSAATEDISPQPTILLVNAQQDWTMYLPRLHGWELWLPRDTDGEVEQLNPKDLNGRIEAWIPRNARLPLSQIQSALELGKGFVQTYCFPQHCDGNATCQLIHNLRPQHLFFFGHDSDRLADLAALEELNSRYQLHLPVLGKTTEFPVGETFFHQPPPDRSYEVNLEDTEQGAKLTFPEALMEDSRWQRLTDTGILQMRWQGDELVLRGLSGRELLHQDNVHREQSVGETLAGQPWSAPNCGNCQAYRGQRCWNEDSPLQGFRVSSDGYCPQHQWI